MTYQVSRNGQMYGPYTLEDLQRYVASGNVLPSDLAKSDEMPDWLPVGQILGGAAAAPASAPSYAAPYAYAQPTGTAYPDPPNLHWGLELLLGIFTCSVFVMVWNLVIAAWANRVQPSSKALIFYIAATVLILFNFGGSWGFVVSIAHHHPQTHRSLLAHLISLACWIVRLIARFTLRDTLEQHFNGPEPIGLRLSAVMTFFFGGIYFQYKLNEVNQIKQALRYRNSAQ
jgi:GYF domain 2